uniref:PGG domain-containing protein n=1 Tax=Quercus lobata TaxID=97700 RepID=A0A7N2MWI7_QUELO
MVSYLFSVTPLKDLTLDERMEILVATITYDILALKILDKDETLETANKRTLALPELARKPFAIGSTSHLSLWKRCLNSSLVPVSFIGTYEHCKRQSSYDFPTVLYDAAKFGNAEFLTILISSYPDIIWIADNQNRSLFHIAVLNQQESVFNLIYETAKVKEIILTYVDDKNENILHLAGYLAPSSRLNIVSGAALQMQQELLWFKETVKIGPPSYLNMKSSGLTPGDLFTKKHKNLRREGEKWMKDTANYCMIVATLITTVVFATAFTVPGLTFDAKFATEMTLRKYSIYITQHFISLAKDRHVRAEE